MLHRSTTKQDISYRSLTLLRGRIVALAADLHVVRYPGSTETIRALEDLLVQARAGEIIGIAFVVMCSGREYAVGIEGETRKAPTFTRGMLHLLDSELAKLLGL